VRVRFSTITSHSGEGRFFAISGLHRRHARKRDPLHNDAVLGKSPKSKRPSLPLEDNLPVYRVMQGSRCQSAATDLTSPLETSDRRAKKPPSSDSLEWCVYPIVNACRGLTLPFARLPQADGVPNQQWKQWLVRGDYSPH
jgi:hypothetical protein